MTNTKITVGPLATWVSGAILIVLCLLQPAAVKAQWTTPDGSGNINNTNTNNVGVGTTAPNYKFDITTSLDRAQVRFGLGAGDSGGYLYSNAPAHAVFSAGASFNGSNWIARSLSASMIEANLGALTFYTNPGISTGSPFTPTGRMRITSGGLVGIGTLSPSYKLHVVSGTDTGTTLLNLDTGVHGGTAMAVAGNTNNESAFDMSVYRGGVYTSRFGVNNFGTVYLQPSGGNVGIGTSTPDQYARLHIYGSGGFGQDIQTTTNDWARLRFVAPSRTWGFFLDSQTGGLISQGSFGLYDYTANAFRMVFHTNGNVGVGVLSPGYKLDVGGSLNASTGLCINGDCKTSWASVGGSQWTTSGSTIFYNTGNVGIGLAAAPSRKLEVLGGNVFHQWGTTAGSEHGFYTAMANNHFSSNLYFDGQWKMIASGKGAVTAVSPAYGWAFSVYGDNTTRAANALSTVTQLFTVTLGGNVGVGTISPVFDGNVSKFMSVDGGSGVIGSIGAAGGISTTNTSVGQLAFVNSNLGTTEKRVATIVGATDTSTDSGRFDFYTASGGTFSSPQMRITSSGNVGIATLSPTEKLEVTGNVKVSGTVEGGNIKAKYQDVAEWVESSQELQGGTVVVLDSSKSNQVVASTQAYDSRVAGVISLQPGITLGEHGEGRVLVATTGRVKVRVDTSNGPIQIGDLLVTSDKEGVAMKSLPVEIGGVRIHRPGTLIGKALEPLAQGTGEILVLLSLQ